MNQYPAVGELRQQLLLDGYLQFPATCRAPETIAVHRGRLRPLLLWLEEQGLEPIQWTRALFVRWLTAKKATPKGFSPRSIQLALTAASMFVDWANKEGTAIPALTAGIERPTVHRGRPTFLALDDAKKVLAVCRGSWSEVFLGLAFFCGMRKSEVKDASWGDVDWAARAITVHGSKVGKDRTVPLSGAILDILSRHRKPAGPMIATSLVTFGTYAMLQRAFKRAGVEWKSPRRARAGSATELLPRGVGFVEARSPLGHGSVSTTDRWWTGTVARGSSTR